jgi:hypothetical protein
MTRILVRACVCGTEVTTVVEGISFGPAVCDDCSAAIVAAFVAVHAG